MVDSPRQKRNDHKQFSSKISDDITCSVCLDILVSPQTLVNCGHTFCRSCCFQLPAENQGSRQNRRQPVLFTNCPKCRQPVGGIVRSRCLESLIHTLVTVPNLLFHNADDQREYERRKAMEKHRESGSALHASSRKRSRNSAETIHARIGGISNLRSNETRSWASSNSWQGLGIPLPAPTTNRESREEHPRTASRFSLDSYDPMLEPLPTPQEDFVFPVGRLRGPRGTNATSRPRQARTTQVVHIPRRVRGSSSSNVPCQRTSRTSGESGVSASDPICID